MADTERITESASEPQPLEAGGHVAANGEPAANAVDAPAGADMSTSARPSALDAADAAGLGGIALTPPAVPVLDWNGCYDGLWGDLIVPDAYQHPAKFARGLVERIIRHGLAEGYWQAGDLIGDPFGGIASGGIVAAYHGLRWVGVELEDKFVRLGRENISLHAAKLNALFGETAPIPVLLQGDSRNFTAIVRDAGGVVTSPPFATGDSAGPESLTKRKDRSAAEMLRIQGWGLGGQCNDRNIAALKTGTVDAVLTSPPYAECIQGDNSQRETAEESRDARRTAGGALGQSCRHAGYGDDPANIGNLKEGAVDAAIMSPPYISGGHHPDQTGAWGGALCDHAHKGLGSKESAGYGAMPGQIGQCQPGDIDGVVTSPPWEDQEPSHAQGTDFRPQRSRKFIDSEYGNTPGQAGNLSGETYWQAIAQVYRNVFEALKPGGVMACVVKDYVKDKARVPLCDHTLVLLARVGFEPLARARAWLVKETKTPGLFGDEIVKRTERKSFFRRLYESKLPADSECRIDWEEVLFVRKTGGEL